MKLKRRVTGKTDYNRRLSMLKSRAPRLVVRKRANSITAQIVSYNPTGDKVLVTAFSKELEKLGWPYSNKNLPAAYLTGLLCGKKATEKQIKKAVLDVGPKTPKHGTRTYAVLKGAVDGGLEINCNESVFPSEDRLMGKHITENVSKIKNKAQFSTYKDAPPADIQTHIEKIKKAISGAHPKVLIGGGKKKGTEEEKVGSRQPDAGVPKPEKKAKVIIGGGKKKGETGSRKPGAGAPEETLKAQKKEAKS